MWFDIQVAGFLMLHGSWTWPKTKTTLSFVSTSLGVKYTLLYCSQYLSRVVAHASGMAIIIFLYTMPKAFEE